MEIKRNRYLNTLISKKHNGLIKVITGMRRCGKSYLLFTLFKEHLLSDGIDEDHIIEIAFDAFENKKYRDPDVEDAAFPALDIPAAPSASVSPTSSVAFLALRLKMFKPLTVVVSFLTSGSPMDLKSPFPVVFFMMALIAPNPIASSGSLGSILIILLRPLDTFSMTLRRALRAADVAFAVSLSTSITPWFRLRVPANRSKEFAVFSSCFPVPLKIFDSPPIPLSATPINFVIPPMATSEIFCHAGANPADSVAVKPSAACPIVL